MHYTYNFRFNEKLLFITAIDTLFFVRAEVAAVALTTRNQIDAFKPYIGMIQALREPEMKAHHFEELLKRTGVQMTTTPTLTFKHLLILGVMKFEDIVMAVANAARRGTL